MDDDDGNWVPAVEVELLFICGAIVLTVLGGCIALIYI